jgi:hypothetical protein
MRRTPDAEGERGNGERGGGEVRSQRAEVGMQKCGLRIQRTTKDAKRRRGKGKWRRGNWRLVEHVRGLFAPARAGREYSSLVPVSVARRDSRCLLSHLAPPNHRGQGSQGLVD